MRTALYYTVDNRDKQLYTVTLGIRIAVTLALLSVV
jgi:hypothetical protein